LTSGSLPSRPISSTLFKLEAIDLLSFSGLHYHSVCIQASVISEIWADK
jgi:hypothetical protein